MPFRNNIGHGVLNLDLKKDIMITLEIQYPGA